MILQDISSEVANTKKTVTFAPGTCGISATYTREGNCPTEGVHTSDGSIFIGNYSDGRWSSDTVRPHHKEILEARKQEGGGPSDNNSHKDKRYTSALKRNKRKWEKLNAQVSSMKTQIASPTKVVTKMKINLKMKIIIWRQELS